MKYQVLQFVSHLIIVIGWIIILFGWVFGIVISNIYSETVRSFSGSTNNESSAFITIAIGVFFTIQGLSMIASGQVYLVLLDIRNDTNKHLNVMRKFVFWSVEKQKDEETEEKPVL